MSLTITVPASVPSLFHNSFPFVPSLARKNNVPFNSVRYGGESHPRVDILDHHRSRLGPVALPQLIPFVPSLARKNSVPLNSVRYDGKRVPASGLMSLTITVPASVPSLFHSSSRSFRHLREEQRSVQLRQILGIEASPAGLMSLTITVPASVPSLFHSSLPFVPSSALKNSVPFTSVRLPGFGSPRRIDVLDHLRPGLGPVALPQLGPVCAVISTKNSVPSTSVKSPGMSSAAGLMSLTIAVPASVPSLFHSSHPFVPSLAQKNNVRSPHQIYERRAHRPGDIGTMCVPRKPSLCHNSHPRCWSLTSKEQQAPERDQLLTDPRLLSESQDRCPSPSMAPGRGMVPKIRSRPSR